MKPKPGQSNMDIFNEYTKIAIEKFGLQEVKQIDLISLRDSISPFINDALNEQELFNYLGIIASRMQEGHTNIEDLDNNYWAGYDFYSGYPSAYSFLIAQEYYYGEAANPNVQTISSSDSYFNIQYGFLPQDNTLGYIRISSFDMTVSEAELEQMMNYLKDAKGIVIDVRGNLGGYINLAARMASYFTQEEIIFGTNHVKNGPDFDDFSASQMKLTPSGSENTFLKKVVVLHDRTTFSSGSLFTIMMYALDNVTTIGQKFGGGTGEIIDGFLSNGWKYNLSTSNLEDAQGNPTDNGIEADIPMVLDETDTDSDALIEQAIVELQ
ncbi:Peptidase family S41 [Lishizhenia tianjinensis]|uniref:Peptidase family S41 n=1 Tax=Lishizhenia tianjinensis TaxID=477690 RepID=A0A1I6XBF0_9FLAO|nr:S41 family peptidase [Lishizhenia tianjinensis]SFT35441.1 Peptidase family S41 [Lishizhenia tianjinensis]